jgi:hypothetical protein
MQRLRVAALVVACTGLVGSARAADNDPTGTWKWNTVRGEATVKLKLEGDKVTGVMIRKNGQELKVEDGTIKNDGEISFNVPGKTPAGKPMVHKYHGKLVGDTIKGTATIELPDQTVSGDWEAKRAKD